MSDRAWQLLDENAAMIREVVASAESIATALSGNADGRMRGGYMLVEEDRVRRLLAAVRAMDRLHLPANT